ncbi:hypothetical protein LTR56_020909 [Elasticomyces elasticus]|nr:hypothetical protein LTR56_020909 [Elasticomyces elasticus]KAK3654308.1 hypothetical protein LTR22_010784 [Elasticomyces elasticus]KAK5749840.1 hypothetical protein LTS12_020130 [Elasticomyces elasticus]
MDPGLQSDDRPCHFLELPRELRDAVYAEVKRNALEDSFTSGYHFSTFRMPHVRLVCRQVRDEYDEEMRRHVTFLIQTGPQYLQGLRAIIRDHRSGFVQLLGRVCDVTLRMEAKVRKRWTANCRQGTAKEIVDQTTGFASELATLAPPQCRLRVELVLKARSVETLANHRWFHPPYFDFRVKSTDPKCTPLPPRLFLKLPLFQAHEPYLGNEAHLAYYMDNLEDNQVGYEAETCWDEDEQYRWKDPEAVEDEYTWQNFRLTMLKATQYDHSSFLHKADGMAATRVRPMGTCPPGDGNDCGEVEAARRREMSLVHRRELDLDTQDMVQDHGDQDDSFDGKYTSRDEANYQAAQATYDTRIIDGLAADYSDEDSYDGGWTSDEDGWTSGGHEDSDGDDESGAE